MTRAGRIRERLVNPWRAPRWLALFTAAYLVWALVPVLTAIQFSFNAGRSRSLAGLLAALVRHRSGPVGVA